jgi:alpha-L-fucosidase
MSQFKRDPMKELRDAALKHGIKFGFYYSHAFDWEHPDAPGNDWDYDNPGGDKLLHGANWWLNFPEFLPHAKKYVSEKSIPQIIELIKKYNPDILWFDTPHKLPLYENIRILQAIRQNDNETKIVVNGRLARYSITQFGDYKSTADRAAFFPPEEGYWESIPTTNESYGYSKVDFSHKPVSYFVRLLASATAKGGNILMNVGPMGNGKWDDTDVKIFQGVGNWLKVYGEAIYGNEKTDLPIQQWGVTTKKEGTLYLHIFHWPKDGNLVIGGLMSDIEKAWIVSDNRAKPLNIKRIDSKDLSIKLPSIAPDTTNTVIAMKVKKEDKAYPIRLLTSDSENVLSTFDSKRIGESLVFGDGKYSRNYVAGWKSNDQYMQWDLRISQPAEFDIYIDYNTESAKDSGIVTIQIADNLYNVNYTPLSGWGKINTIHAGKIKLKKGEFKGTLKGIEYEGTQYMRPIAIRLVPINSK